MTEAFSWAFSSKSGFEKDDRVWTNDIVQLQKYRGGGLSRFYSINFQLETIL